MSVFYTSDTHLGHRKVAQIRWQQAFPGIELPERIEHVLKWHDSILAQRWDATVTKDDVVWVLGDLALTNTKAGMARVLDWFTQRPGRKHLIPGNHDPVHPLHRDAHKWQKIYLEVFESVQLAARRKFTLPDHSTREVLLSHLPYAGDRDGTDREPQWRLRDEGDWLLHGHLHGTTPLHTVGTRQLDVGLDPWGLAPVSEETLLQLMFVLENPNQTLVPFTVSSVRP